ncbi:nuclear transport factor 2 family protein [Streptomyces sp. NPDC055287]
MSVTARTNTRTVVEELLLRIGEGDPERIAELYAEHGDWKLNCGRRTRPYRHAVDPAEPPGPTWRPTTANSPSTTCRSRRATEVERIVIDGNDAIVLGEIRRTARSTGRAYRARFALHLTVEDGLVTRHHVYEDSLAVAQAFDAERE